MVSAEGVFDDAAAHGVNGRHAAFGVDEKVLPADGAADLRGELCWLAYVHRLPAFLFLLLQIQETAANHEFSAGIAVSAVGKS